MARHNKIGNIGEDLAADYLHRNGYQILERNWRFSKAEIDIIAKHQEILVFVEVKSLGLNSFNKPEASVTDYKQRLIKDAAGQYMLQVNHDWEIRFDVISILLNEGELIDIKHFEDAFYN